MTDYQSLSESELQAIIDNAEKALKIIQANKRKDVIAQIKDLAASIDVAVDIYETDKKPARKGSKVAVKYRHPNDPEKTWTGRGVMPTWLQTFMNEGRDRSEFEI
ncbi:H-NS family nucleoid-associated regulatory protein [Methylobacter sp. S3L5C]|uniref:H-NS histone family protein n=1 Tax=Methylobacter sp. S3L5C TaxID=2839024 RepID=UPI001FAC8C35|nr:H-NS histone family protein [Methylobacter sp. S3L5C]UOA08171.1 H-NS histone family protein [Methylobacter sp. S3L5C]